MPIAPNPRFKAMFEGFRKSDQDAVQQLLYSELLKARPKGDESFFLFSVSTKRDFEKCFPKRPSSDHLAEFFNHLPLGESLARDFDFRDGAKFWFFAVRSKDNWESALKTIEDETTRPGLDKQYGISVAAGKLLSWIKGLPADKYTGPWTPIVEDACDRWIGISCPWSQENFPAYLQLLIDEINDRTEYDLSLQPWRQYGQTKLRIKVGRKVSETDEVVKRIQRLALKSGVTLDVNVARERIEKLVNSPAIPQSE